MALPPTVNTFAFIDRRRGSTFAIDALWATARDGGYFTLRLETSPTGGAGKLRDEVAEHYAEAEGDIGLALSDGEIVASGVIVDAAHDGEDLQVRIDDAARVSREEGPAGWEKP